VGLKLEPLFQTLSGGTMTDGAQTGLSENSAAAISYITFIPAIVFLATPPYNQSPTVRFHSWQSIFLTVASVAFWIVFTIVRVMGSFIFFMHFVFLLISMVCWLGWFAIWILCVINALNGKRISLPIIGPLAAKQAGAQ
jgi:uncharacterized membrane protein